MIRLLFNRKNKTLRAVLTTKTVLKLLETNRQTVLSLAKSKAKKDESETMDTTVTDDQNKRPIRDVIEEILSTEQWKGKRASKLDLDDFLQLLAEFNAQYIHFS